MRRFIDVVFIHPKNRYYVVLHQGKFWQLSRMNLSVSSWVFKLLYKGSLGDIFVARNQAVVDEKLSKILKTYELPAQLHGLNANRFLDWWEMNDYKWLSTKDVITLETLPTATPKPVEPPKTVITPAALAILQKKRLISEQDGSVAPLPTNSTKTNPPTPTTDQAKPVEPPTQTHKSPITEDLQEFDDFLDDFASQNTQIPTPNATANTQPADDLDITGTKTDVANGSNDLFDKTTSPAPSQNKTVVNDSLLGRFKLSPQADFTPNSAIASPIPNPPPKANPQSHNQANTTQQTTQQHTAQQEPSSMPQPASRPMSKLHEFNAQFGKKTVTANSNTPRNNSILTNNREQQELQSPSNNRTLVQSDQVKLNTINQASTSQNSAVANNHSAANNPIASKIQHNHSQHSPILTANMPTNNQQTTSTSTPASKERTSVLDESFDIFDDLLKELTDELIPN